MNQNEYAEFDDSPKPTNEAFAQLADLVDQVRAAETQCEEAAELLKKAQEKLRDLNNRQLPQMMEDLGLEEFTTSTGFKIEIKKNIEAGITVENRPKAHEWLDDNGHSGLLKRQVLVAFNRDQTGAARELVAELSQKYPGVSESQSVHASTLKAWVREMLAAGEAIPMDLFGVIELKQAKISQAKKKK